MKHVLNKVAFFMLALTLQGCSTHEIIAQLPIGDTGYKIEVIRQDGGGATVGFTYQIFVVTDKGSKYELAKMWRLSCLSLEVDGRDVVVSYSNGARIKNFTNIIYVNGDEYETILRRVNKCSVDSIIK